MNDGLALLLAFCIGVVAGLRSLITPAIVAWAAHLGWINLHGSVFSFMGTKWALGLFTILALVELIVDKLRNTPSRTSASHLIARIVSGGLCGACLAVAGAATPWLGALAGSVAAIASAFGSYHARASLVRALHVPDFVIAIPEDLVTVGLGVLLVTRF